jgi:hypothetical protein
MDGKWIGMNSVNQDALPATERKALCLSTQEVEP